MPDYYQRMKLLYNMKTFLYESLRPQAAYCEEIIGLID
jgi:hypothetical protein